jgi:hypothetical protein
LDQPVSTLRDRLNAEISRPCCETSKQRNAPVNHIVANDTAVPAALDKLFAANDFSEALMERD